MELVNVTDPVILILLQLLWVGFVVYASFAFFRIFKANKSLKKLNPHKNFTGLDIRIAQSIDLFVCFLIVIFISVILLRPVAGRDFVAGQQGNLDIVFVVDNSPSMAVKDFFKETGVDRLAGAKKFIAEFVEKQPSFQYALLSFANNAYLDVPLTPDRNTINISAQTLAVVDEFNAGGTTFKTAFEVTKQYLEQANLSPARSRIVIFISDGEQIGEEIEDYTNELKALTDLGATVFSVGIGTKDGDRIPKFEYNGTTSYYRVDGIEAVSKLDERALRSIASVGEGTYFHFEPNSKIESIIQDISVNAKFGEGNGVEPVYIERYYYFAPVVLALLIPFEFEIYKWSKQKFKKNKK